jgi:hypothetical protein
MKDIFQLKNSFALLLMMLITVSTSLTVSAQVFPVQANMQISGPYSPYLSDYTAPGAQKLLIQLRTNDITISDHPIKLRITIEGVGITIRTKQNFIPAQPLTLAGGGIPSIFYGEDIIEYFNPNNLDFVGLSRKEFEKTGKLPEGVYRFTAEVFSYNRDVTLSNKAMTVAWIILNDPPLLNLPRKDLKVRILDPTNIVFNWTPRHTGSPNSAFTTEYIFRLVEIWPANRNPYDAFLSQPALYEINTSQTQILYGPAEPALIPGRKYAWQVQAIDVEGKDLFKNQGRSEVFVFQFGDALSAPENVKQDVGNATAINLSWEPPSQGEMPLAYRVRYRKKGTGDSGTWYEAVTNQRWATLPSLQTNSSYEVQVRSEAKPQVSEYSALTYVKTDEEKVVPYSCGKQSVVPPVDNSSPLLMLFIGDVITAGNFKVIVTKAEGSGGSFTGTGVMVVPLLNMASVNVTFSGIQLNDKHELVYGEIVTTYNPGSEIARKVEEAHQIGEKPEPPKASDSTGVTTAITIPVSGIIDSVYFDKEKGEIVVMDEEGNKNTYKQPIGEVSKEPMPVQIVDAVGNTYVVDKDGKVTKSPGAGSVAGKPVSASQLDDFGKLVRTVLLEVRTFDSLKIVHSADSLNTGVKKQLDVLSKVSDSGAGGSIGFRPAITKDFTDTEALSASEGNAMKQDSDLKILMESVEMQDFLYSRIMANWKKMKLVAGYLDVSNFHSFLDNIKQQLIAQNADLKDLPKIKPSIISLVNERIRTDAN